MMSEDVPAPDICGQHVSAWSVISAVTRCLGGWSSVVPLRVAARFEVVRATTLSVGAPGRRSWMGDGGGWGRSERSLGSTLMLVLRARGTGISHGCEINAFVSARV